MSRVSLEIRNRAALLWLDNPRRANSLTMEMLESLEHYACRLDEETEIRAVILAGRGGRIFCSGADITAWGDLSPTKFARIWVRQGHRIFDRLARLSKPTIAAISGAALGGGLELAAACDIRMMNRETVIGLPETGVGIVPGWSGTQRLVRLLPEPMVKEMLLFGRRISAERALAAGFAAELADDPVGAALEIVERMEKTSPRATEAGKFMIHAAVGEDRAAMVDALAGGMVAAIADRKEGVEAFREKRQPRFSNE